MNADGVNPKRSESNVAHSVVKMKRPGTHTPVASIHHTHLQHVKSEALDEIDDVSSGDGSVLWQFRAEVLPTQRQTFYCVCDILVDEVQELVHSNDGKVRAFRRRHDRVCHCVWSRAVALLFLRSGNFVLGARRLARFRKHRQDSRHHDAKARRVRSRRLLSAQR